MFEVGQGTFGVGQAALWSPLHRYSSAAELSQTGAVVSAGLPQSS